MYVESFGKRLRKRARELDLPDAEIARRVGLSTQRYGHYVAGRREPDLATLVRICRALDVTPNDVLLGPMKSVGRSRVDKLNARLNAAANVLETDDLRVAVKQVEVFVEHRTGRRPRRQAETQRPTRTLRAAHIRN